MKKIEFTQGQYHIDGFVLSAESCPVVYCLMDAASVAELAECLDGEKLVLAAVSGMDWADDLSPWPAPRAFRGGHDFGGRADAYLQGLVQGVIPAVEQRLSFSPVCRVIGGYSLAGLCALYAMYRTDCFDRLVCASGSLWYDGFLDFMRQNSLRRVPEAAYFSLGDKEKQIRNQRMAVVEDCMKEATAFLQQQGTRTIFEQNPGGHFNESTERLAKGIRWALNG